MKYVLDASIDIYLNYIGLFQLLYMLDFVINIIQKKNKIRFLKQFFRWFIKDPVGYKIKLHLKERYTSRAPLKISDGDIIHLTCRTNKAAWKKNDYLA